MKPFWAATKNLSSSSLEKVRVILTEWKMPKVNGEIIPEGFSSMAQSLMRNTQRAISKPHLVDEYFSHFLCSRSQRKSRKLGGKAKEKLPEDRDITITNTG